MSDELTARLALPLLQPGQAQKEMTHNEALALLDAAVLPCVAAIGATAPPDAPASGSCWALGNAPTGDWSGRAGAIACWTSGGWRFVAAAEGMSIWSVADTLPARYRDGAWQLGVIDAASVRIGGAQVLGVRRPAIADASGGDTIDVEARAALSSLLDAVRAHGLIAAS